MASRHPLDVFQSSSSGFEKASRRRRTISGKVITHRAREAEELPAEPGDDAEESATPEPDEAALEVEAAVDAAPGDEPEVVEAVEAPEPAADQAEQASQGKPRRKTRGRRKDRQQAAAAEEPSAPMETAEVPAAPRAPAPAAEPRRPTRITGAAARPGRQQKAPAAAAPSEPRPNAPGQVGRRPLLPRGRPGPGLSKVLLGGTVAVVLALVVWIGMKTFGGGDEGPELAVLNRGEALGQPELDPGMSAAVEVWTIQAASYSPTEMGQRMAWDAHDELVARGYTDVLVSGQQGLDDQGRTRLESCVLLVGRSADQEQLQEQLARLVAVGDWPHGSRRPFTDARLVEHPHP